jgi:hypothetical protein
MKPKTDSQRFEVMARALVASGHLTEDERYLCEKALQVLRRLDEGGDGEFHVNTIVSRRTGDGLLDVVWFGQAAQIDVVKAREIAWILLEAASAAQTDEMFVRFAHEKIGVPREAATAMLQDFRDYRAEKPRSLVDHKEKPH